MEVLEALGFGTYVRTEGVYKNLNTYKSIKKKKKKKKKKRKKKNGAK